MTEKQFQIIHLGNPYDFVVKDHQTNKTYGTLQGDDKSLMKLLNELHEENDELKQENERLKELLRKAEHELTSITGLIATDGRTLVKEDIENYDLFRLDCSELVNEIEKELIE